MKNMLKFSLLSLALANGVCYAEESVTVEKQAVEEVAVEEKSTSGNVEEPIHRTLAIKAGLYLNKETNERIKVTGVSFNVLHENASGDADAALLVVDIVDEATQKEKAIPYPEFFAMLKAGFVFIEESK